jgi:hypothetical protein
MHLLCLSMVAKSKDVGFGLCSAVLDPVCIRTGTVTVREIPTV